METWRLLACLSTLFSAARVQVTGCLDSSASWMEQSTVNSTSSVAGKKRDDSAELSGIRR